MSSILVWGSTNSTEYLVNGSKLVLAGPDITRADSDSSKAKEKERREKSTHKDKTELREVEKMFGIKHKFGAVYHPASQGLVERANQTIKEGLAKVCADTKLTWIEALPIVLFNIRSTPNAIMSVSPHEILRKMPCPLTTAPTDSPPLLLQCETLCEYVKQLNNAVMSISQKVTAILTKEHDTSPVEVGNWVLRKVNKLNWSPPQWKGPYKVTEATSHCVKVWLTEDRLSNWIHKTHCTLTLQNPTERTLTEVPTDLRTSPTDNDHNTGNETSRDTGQTLNDEAFQEDSTMETGL